MRVADAVGELKAAVPADGTISFAVGKGVKKPAEKKPRKGARAATLAFDEVTGQLTVLDFPADIDAIADADLPAYCKAAGVRAGVSAPGMRASIRAALGLVARPDSARLAGCPDGCGCDDCLIDSTRAADAFGDEQEEVAE